MWGTARRRDDSGAAALEFALVLVPLLTILYGIISYGYLLAFRQSLSQAASEGARAAAVAPRNADTPAKTALAETAVNQSVDVFGPTCGTSGMTCTVAIQTCAPGSSKDCVAVTVSYPYADEPLLPMLPFVPLPSELSYEAVAEVSK